MKEYPGKKASAPRTAPYGDLYVYSIRGRVPGMAAFFDESMLALREQESSAEIIFEEPREKEVVDYLKQHHPAAEYDGETRLHYRDWESGYEVAPVRVAGFLLCPPWQLEDPGPYEKRMVLDAGLSFGAGMHPTTQTCLVLLRQAFMAQTPAHVLDLGCGSGVLSVAAALLGAPQCTAVDTSSMAVHYTALNAQINSVHERIEIINGDAAEHIAAADLILCNINPAVIFELLEQPGFRQARGIIFSGIHIREKQLQLERELRAHGRDITHCVAGGSWRSFLSYRNEN